MNLNTSNEILTGLSIILISNGCLTTFKKSDKISNSAKFQLKLGLSGMNIIGIIKIYKAIYK